MSEGVREGEGRRPKERERERGHCDVLCVVTNFPSCGNAKFL